MLMIDILGLETPQIYTNKVKSCNKYASPEKKKKIVIISKKILTQPRRGDCFLHYSSLCLKNTNKIHED